MSDQILGREYPPVTFEVEKGRIAMFARAIGDFVNEHPSMKLLALSFMLLIGVLLVAEGFDQHLPKGYVYAAMGFALFVELLNMRLRKRARLARAEAKAAAAQSNDSSSET